MRGMSKEVSVRQGPLSGRPAEQGDVVRRWEKPVVESRWQAAILFLALLCAGSQHYLLLG